MSYSFDFDLTKISRSFFKDVAGFVDRKDLHRKTGNMSRKIVEKMNINEATGIPMTDAITLMEDMVDIHTRNLLHEKEFQDTEKRALFLPHCSRKYMDSRCKAEFDPEVSSYRCKGCSDDCPVNRATTMAEDRGYDVFVFPGGSCIPKVLRRKNYDGVVGVACSEEVKIGMEKLEEVGVNYQGIPLLKNGCANTRFNIDTLKRKL